MGIVVGLNGTGDTHGDSLIAARPYGELLRNFGNAPVTLQELADADSRDVDLDENLFASGLVDSVGFMRLIAHLSDALGVAVPAEDLVPENFRTVRVMARYVAGLLA